MIAEEILGVTSSFFFGYMTQSSMYIQPALIEMVDGVWTISKELS